MKPCRGAGVFELAGGGKVEGSPPTIQVSPARVTVQPELSPLKMRVAVPVPSETLTVPSPDSALVASITITPVAAPDPPVVRKFTVGPGSVNQGGAEMPVGAGGAGIEEQVRRINGLVGRCRRGSIVHVEAVAQSLLLEPFH